MATMNSVAGVLASRVIWATPPKMKSVMLRTGIPRAKATTLWASSWASTDAKKTSAVAPASSQPKAPVDIPSDNRKVNMKKTRNHV